MAAQKDIITTLFKKNQGYANTNTSAEITQEPILSEPFAKASRIATQMIPLTEPSDLSAESTLTAGGTKQTSAAYPYIVKYTNIPLTGIPANPNFAFYEATGNLLLNAILPTGSNYNVKVTDSTLTTTINSANYILDRDAGTLSYFPNADVLLANSDTKIPRITFWRYEGTFLSDSGLSGTTSLTTFTSQSGTQKFPISKDLSWSQSSTSPNGDFTGMATSYDGKFRTLLTSTLGQGGYVYVSNDYGNTYKSSELNFYNTSGSLIANYSTAKKDWKGVVMSKDGVAQFIFTWANEFFLSFDSGNTWYQKNINLSQADNAAMSSDGKYILICSSSLTTNNIVYTTNWGGSWSTQTYTYRFNDVTMSEDGAFQFGAANGYGLVYRTENSGSSWTQIYIGESSVNFVSCSNDGKYVLAGTSDTLYLSTNYGITYAQVGPILVGSDSWLDGRVSGDGKRMIACKAGLTIPYISIDFGSTWFQFESTTSYNSIQKDGYTTMVYLINNGSKAFVLCRGYSSINKLIETQGLPYTQTIIKADVAYWSNADLLKNMDAQFVVRGSNTPVALKFSAQYTPGIVAAGIIQATDLYNGLDNPQMLNLNPLGGNIGINCNAPKAQLDVNGDVRIMKNILPTTLQTAGTLSSFSQVTIGQQSVNTSKVYLGQNYTPGNAYGFVQACTFDSGPKIEVGDPMFINPLGGTVVLGKANVTTTPGVYSNANLNVYGGSGWPYKTGISVTIPQRFSSDSNAIYFNGGFVFYDNGGSGIHAISMYEDAPRQVGLFVSRHIWTESGFIASSDQRIKTNIRPANKEEALNDLRAIQPMLYNYKDPIERGTDEVYGFIAQNVSSCFSYAVSFQRSVVPDYFSTCAVDIQAENSTTYVTFKDVTSSFLQSLSTSQCVKFIDGSYTPYLIHVSSVSTSDNKFTAITPYEIKDLSGNVFLYGSEVDDFQVLDKNALFTLNFAATKDIDEIQQTHASRISVLEAQVSTLQAQVSQLMAGRA